MTVKKLMKVLEDLPPDMEVHVNGFKTVHDKVTGRVVYLSLFLNRPPTIDYNQAEPTGGPIPDLRKNAERGQLIQKARPLPDYHNI